MHPNGHYEALELDLDLHLRVAANEARLWVHSLDGEQLRQRRGAVPQALLPLQPQWLDLMSHLAATVRTLVCENGL